MQIFGVTAVNVSDLLQSLRKEGDVVTIGTETGVLESKRCVNKRLVHSLSCPSELANGWVHSGQAPTPSGVALTEGNGRLLKGK